MKKLAVLCILMVLFLSSCGLGPVESIYHDEGKLADRGDLYNLNVTRQEIDGTHYTGKMEFEGMDTVWVYDAKEDGQVNVTYSLSVTHGRAKLVYVDPQGNISTIVQRVKPFEQKKLETVSLHLKKGKNRIKLVGLEKAKMDMELLIEEGKLQKVGKE